MSRRDDAAAEAVDQEDVAAVVGTSGAGKSTHVKAVLGAYEGDAVVWDPHDEFSQQGRASTKVTLGPIEDRRTVAEFLAACAKEDLLWREDTVRVAVVPEARGPGEVAEEFARFADGIDGVLRARSKAGLILWVSELQLLNDAESRGWLEYWATQGRHLGEGIVLGMDAQAAVMVPPNARKQVKWFKAFALLHRLDLDALEDMGGVTMPDRWRETVPNLGPHEYLFWEAPLRKQRREQRHKEK